MEQKNKGSCITFGCEAGGRPNRRQRRGARRRKNKGLREAEHHVRYAGAPRRRPTKKGPTHSRSS